VSIQIQEGKYYRRRDGQVTGPVILRSGETYRHVTGGYSYTPNGEYNVGADDDRDLIAEVTVTDVLPFELKAGERYDTVNADGTPGPVVALRRPHYSSHALYREVPFVADGHAISIAAFVTRHGELFSSDEWLGRITAPYIAPPPTIAERLERAIELLANPRQDDSAFALIRGCVAELKNTESRPKDSTAG
jgi:hypothetical protein